MSASEITATKWTPTPAQRTMLETLSEAVKQYKTQAEFVRRHWPRSASHLSQVLDALDPARESYMDRTSPAQREQTMAEIAAVLDELPRRRRMEAKEHELEILRTSKLRATEQAIREAADKPGEERLVVVLAPTGGGKTMIANNLASRMNARRVQVRECWRHSGTGYVPLLDICAAVGVRIKRRSRSDIAGIQDELLTYCTGRRMVVVFDEGEHFGRSSLNLLKLLLNETRIVPVILCIPGEYDRWLDYWEHETLQIRRRTHAIIEQGAISEADCRLFVPEEALADPDKGLEFLAREVSAFGHFSLLARVARLLAETRRAKQEDLVDLLAKARKQMLPDRARK